MNDLALRLREQFEAQYKVADNGCWLWLRKRNNVGYGTLNVFGGFALAHRLAYELYVGAVPDGLVLDHQCETRTCVNPHHLKPVTHQENILRGNGLAAQNARKTHCLRGHLLGGDNVYLNAGRRHCKECTNIRARKNQARTRRAAGVPERIIGPRSKKFAEIGATI